MKKGCNLEDSDAISCMGPASLCSFEVMQLPTHRVSCVAPKATGEQCKSPASLQMYIPSHAGAVSKASPMTQDSYTCII